MALSVDTLTIDCHDLKLVADFWCVALGYRLVEIDDEVARLEAAGASVIRRVDEGGSFWTVMADPEGNELCVLRGPGGRVVR